MWKIFIAKELLKNATIETESTEKPKTLSKKFTATRNQQQYSRKVMHGYFQRKLQTDTNIENMQSDHVWKTRKQHPTLLAIWMLSLTKSRVSAGP